MSDGKKKFIKTFLSILRILIISYVGILVFVYFFQSIYAYRPSREIINKPNEIGLTYEDVSFKASDGVKLAGWFIPAENSAAVVLFCHSNAGNISYYLDSVRIFHQLGLNVFIFDYRGYGKSEGSPTENGTYLDAEAAWNYLTNEKQTPLGKIVIVGRSLGGAIGAWLAKKHNPKALILESAFTSFTDIAAKFFPYLPARLVSRYSYNTAEYIRQIKCPILIVHSRDDEVVPFSHGVKLFELANAPKEFLEISGSHNDGFISSGKRYTDGLNNFITKYTVK